jgi:hypothetical protein
MANAARLELSRAGNPVVTERNRMFLSVELNFRQRIYREVHLLAKLF